MTSWRNDSPALCDKKYAQYSSFPIKYPRLVELTNKQEAVLWTEKELSFKDDILQFALGILKTHGQNEKAKHAFMYVSGFFLFGDGIIGGCISEVLSSKIVIREILDFYALQSYIESVHNKFYSLVVESLFPEHKDTLRTELEKFPAIKKKVEWAMKWVKANADIPVQQTVVAGVIIESIFFTTSFALIYWIKGKGKLPAVTDGNDMVSRDENIHRDFGCEVYKLVEDEYRLPENIIYDMIHEATEAECEFINEAMQGESLEGFNIDDAISYPKYIADLLLTDLGYIKIFNQKNPFPWIKLMSIAPRKNFFEKTVTEYQKAHTQISVQKRDGFDFTSNPDF